MHTKLRRMIPLLALLAAFPPMATDMYLPAIPMLQAQWHVTLPTINLTLVLFFVGFSLSLLIYGPLSDRYGRRPVLLAGISMFILASWICSLAWNVQMLIGSRVLQALGAGAASSLSMAICRDVFEDRERERALAYMGVIVSLAPMLSPIIGSWILRWLSWPWIFVMQGLLGCGGLLGVVFMKEPLRHKLEGSPWKVFTLYARVMRNTSFVIYTLLMAVNVCPIFAYIGGSSDIYITGFGLDEQTFGYFFGANALAIMIGSFLCVRLGQNFSSRKVLVGSFCGILAGGIWLTITGPNGPWGFALPMFFITLCMGVSRPLSNNLVLKQVSTEVGTASSLMIFTYFVFGAVSIWVISLDWQWKPRLLGLLSLVTSSLVLFLFIFLESRPHLSK